MASRKRHAVGGENRRTGRERASGVGVALVVDDEFLVRMSTADMLSDLGYEVVEANSGEEALNLVEKGLEPVLLVTDHLMPGITGTELVTKLRADFPNLQALIVSGYADLEGVPSDVARLTKPFRAEELASMLVASASECSAGPGRELAGISGRDRFSPMPGAGNTLFSTP